MTSDSFWAYVVTFWFFIAPLMCFYGGIDVDRFKVEQECLSKSYFKSRDRGYSCNPVVGGE